MGTPIVDQIIKSLEWQTKNSMYTTQRNIDLLAELKALKQVKNINYDTLLYSVFNDIRCDFDADDEDYEEEEEIEPDGYQCMCCGNIQDKATGFGCNRCAGPMTEWYC